MTPRVEHVDLAAVPGAGGVVWSLSPDGFHTNLVALVAGESIGRHRNNELDVLIVVLSGDAQVTIDDERLHLGALHAALVPRGTRRSITAGGRGVRYLTIHRDRAGITIGSGGVDGGE